jgi:hypothetical protein
MSLPFQDDHWLPDFNFNVEEWFEGDRYETLAICRTLALARAVFAAALAEKPAGRFRSGRHYTCAKSPSTKSSAPVM